MKKLQKLQNNIQKWSDSQFGYRKSGLPMAHHLKKEVNELIIALEEFDQAMSAGPDISPALIKLNKVKEEFADCFMLLLDSAAHSTIKTKYLLLEMEKKLKVNKSRKWGEPDENGVVEHITEDNETNKE